MSDLKKHYNDNGILYKETYHNYYNGDLHREDGPAKIEYYKDGTKNSETYSINNEFHREDGPAFIMYDRDGSVLIFKYYKDNKLHRENGPCCYLNNKEGGIFYWYYNIKNYTDLVEKWIITNEFNSYEEMSNSDFDLMWNEIL